jgi:hypothetical protein
MDRPPADLQLAELVRELQRRVEALEESLATGKRVLTALAAGRTKANEAKKRQAAYKLQLVQELAAAADLASRPRRGLAGRISRKLGKMGLAISERQVQKYLATLSSSSDSLLSNVENTDKEQHNAQRAA